MDGRRSALISSYSPIFYSAFPFYFRIVEPKVISSFSSIFIVSRRTIFFVSEFPPSSPTNFTVIDFYPSLFEDRKRDRKRACISPIPKSFLHFVCQGKGLPEDGTIYACVFQRRKRARRESFPESFARKVKGEWSEG